MSTVGKGNINLVVESVAADKLTYTAAMDNFKMTLNMGEAGAQMGMPGDTTIDVKDMNGKRTRIVSTMLGRQISSEIVDTITFSNPLMKQFAGSSKNYLRVLMELPENAMGTGDTWTVAKKDTQDTEGGAVVSESKINATYVRDVDTLGHKCAVFNYTISIGIEGKMKIQQQFDATIAGDGSGKGSAYFDAKAGRLVANVSSLEMNQQIAITGQMSMIIPQSITTTTNMALLP